MVGRVGRVAEGRKTVVLVPAYDSKLQILHTTTILGQGTKIKTFSHDIIRPNWLVEDKKKSAVWY